jgi:hypothetical protein
MNWLKTFGKFAAATFLALAFIFGACAVASFFSGCIPIGSTGGSGSIGGSPSLDAGATGGALSTGGTNSQGGSASTGGSSATGGTSVCLEPERPTPNSLVASDARQAKFHKLSGRHLRAANRAPITPEATTDCWPWQHAPRPNINQLSYGACAGFTGIAMIASAPFNDLAFYGFNYGLEAYQGGTCIDNGCAVPCTSKSCPRAFNPTTGANDTGTYGSSVATWLVKMDLLDGFTTADTVSDLKAGLTRSTCMIGVDFRATMYTPGTNGRLQIGTAAQNVGGHEMLAVDFDAKLPVEGGGVWVRTSWGPVWWCIASEVDKNTPIDGTGCGYAWIATSDLPKLHFDGDCPIVPTVKVRRSFE